MSNYQQYKELLFRYGKVGLCVHIIVSILFFLLIWILVSYGVDIASWLPKILSRRWIENKMTGNLLVSYAGYKVLMPIRLAVTCALTPFLARNKISSRSHVK
jgi:hypothetical protein